MFQLVLVTAAVLLAMASTSYAHGGGSFRGPPRPPNPGCSEPWGGVPLPPPETPGRGPVTGLVLGEGGAPVADVVVPADSTLDWAAADVAGAWRREACTDASGAFGIDGGCGRRHVHAVAPGLTNDERPCTAPAGAGDVLVVVDEEPLPH